MKTICLLVATALLSSCASILTRSYQTVHFQTTDPGAKVIVNDNMVGTTPCDVRIKKRISAPRVVIKKEGYDNKYLTMDQKIHPVVFLNILNGGVGVFIDALTGKVWKYEKSYLVDLDKSK
jgi:hypothetical protein